jgi:hypothetical protein
MLQLVAGVGAVVRGTAFDESLLCYRPWLLVRGRTGHRPPLPRLPHGSSGRTVYPLYRNHGCRSRGSRAGPLPHIGPRVSGLTEYPLWPTSGQDWWLSFCSREVPTQCRSIHLSTWTLHWGTPTSMQLNAIRRCRLLDTNQRKFNRPDASTCARFLFNALPCSSATASPRPRHKRTRGSGRVGALVHARPPRRRLE